MGMERSSNSRRSERFGERGSSVVGSSFGIVLTHKEVDVARMLQEDPNTMITDAMKKVLLRIFAKLPQSYFFYANEAPVGCHSQLGGRITVSGPDLNLSRVMEDIRVEIIKVEG